MLGQYFVFYGIIFRKMAAERYKVVLLRTVAIHYWSFMLTRVHYPFLNPKYHIRMFEVRINSSLALSRINNIFLTVARYCTTPLLTQNVASKCFTTVQIHP